MLRETITENGRVRGIPAADPRITAYKGIPFAAPPVGDLRWKGPQPAKNWDGVLECNAFGPIAMQVMPGLNPDNIYSREWNVDTNLTMSEDCLQLNVWTPAKSADEKLPVMVWFYGGGLREGHPSEMEFDGERIARRGIVLVTVNYRVNIFGFFSHPEITATAEDKCYTNFGSYDQRAGLMWTKRNIANFGGDPDNITIFGQSAGGRSVLFQLCSPLNDTDHIKRAISMSGGGINLMSFMKYLPLKEAEERGVKFLEFIGAKNLEEAKKMDAFFIRDKWVEFEKQFGMSFGFTVDGVFATEDPADLLSKGKRLPVPVMAGHTSADMFDAFSRKPTKEALKAQIVELVGEERAGEVLDLAGFDTCSLDEIKDNLAINMQRLGVELFHMRCADDKLPSYFYCFDAEIPGWDNPGAFHSSDLWFVFETLAKCWRPFKGKHYDLARQMCNYWTNFAKTGDPNGPDNDGAPMPEWKAFSKEEPFSMDFTDFCAMREKEEKPAVKLLLEKMADTQWRKK